MALYPRVRQRALALHIRDTLRAGINAQITQAIAETPAAAPASGLATFQDITNQVQIGDHQDYEPLHYPCIRVANARVQLQPISSAAVVDSLNTYDVAVYTEQQAGRGACAGDVFEQLTETTIDLVECVRSCLERDFTSATFGDLVLCSGYERTPAPQDAERPCTLRMRYQMTWQIRTRLRHSRGAST